MTKAPIFTLGLSKVSKKQIRALPSSPYLNPGQEARGGSPQHEAVRTVSEPMALLPSSPTYQLGKEKREAGLVKGESKKKKKQNQTRNIWVNTEIAIFNH